MKPNSYRDINFERTLIKEFQDNIGKERLLFKPLKNREDLGKIKDLTENTTKIVIVFKRYIGKIMLNICDTRLAGNKEYYGLVFSKDGQGTFCLQSNIPMFVKKIKNMSKDCECVICYSKLNFSNSLERAYGKVSCHRCSSFYCKPCKKKIDKCSVCRAPFQNYCQATIPPDIDPEEFLQMFLQVMRIKQPNTTVNVFRNLD